jgi:arginine/lysine/ornithine decarboxylase
MTTHPHRESDAPFLRALQKKKTELSSTFFLPTHQGGRFVPVAAREVLGDGLYDLDLPELDGLGNVHDFNLDGEDAISQALRKASNFAGSLRTWFLVNGSTSGILIAMMVLKATHSRNLSSSSKKSVVIVSRDAHKSVFDALELAQCDALVLPCSIDEAFGVSTGVDADTIIKSIAEFRAHPDHGDTAEIAGIVLTRPTYQGLGLHGDNFTDLIRQCHSLNVPVVVDEAHGSHWQLLSEKEGYGGALSCGADLVVQSTHKTLGALCQAGMLHLGVNAFAFLGGATAEAAVGTVHHYYSMLTSTSPSAVLLASIDAARAQAEVTGEREAEMTAAAVQDMQAAVESAVGTGKVEFLRGREEGGETTSSTQQKQQHSVVDPLRLTVRFPEYPSSAISIDDWMCEELGLWCELNLPRCIVYCIPLGAGAEDLRELQRGLILAVGDSAAVKGGNGNTNGTEEDSVTAPDGGDTDNESLLYLQYSAFMGGGDKDTAAAVVVPLHAASGATAAESVVPYPPGIPLLLRGERIKQRHIASLQKLSTGAGAGGVGSGTYVLCSIAASFFLLFLLFVSLIHLLLPAHLHSLAPHGTSLTIIPSPPRSINHQSTHYSHCLLITIQVRAVFGSISAQPEGVLARQKVSKVVIIVCVCVP